MIRRTHPIYDAAQVAGGLWIGSHPPYHGHRCEDHDRDYGADLGRYFDSVALCATGFQPPAEVYPGAEVIHAPFDDSLNPTPEEIKQARSCARKVCKIIRSGRSCLVTCMAGRNRSGLVSALALAEASGVHPGVAGEIVRKARGPLALTNHKFRELLNRGWQAVCELCLAEPVTKRYHEDSVCWIADCLTCQVPMVTYRWHSSRPRTHEIQYMVKLLSAIGPGRIEADMKSIPDHWHAHLRNP